MKLRNVFYAAAASGTMMLMGSGLEAQTNVGYRDGPYITVVHDKSEEELRRVGGQKYRHVNCGDAIILNGVLMPTPTFVQQIDSNNQDITAGRVPDPRTIKTLADAHKVNQAYTSVEEARNNIASVIAKLAVEHMKQVHDECHTRERCVLVRAQEACKQALGLG